MKSGKWWVACWECEHGINGKKDCNIDLHTIGVKAKSLQAGCSTGYLLEIYREAADEKQKKYRYAIGGGSIEECT